MYTTPLAIVNENGTRSGLLIKRHASIVHWLFAKATTNAPEEMNMYMGEFCTTPTERPTDETPGDGLKCNPWWPCTLCEWAIKFLLNGR